MKTGIHPEYMVAKVTCACGRVTETRATVPELHVDICSHCHPFFTGRQKLVDTAGRVERFRAKYGNGESTPASESPAEVEEPVVETVAETDVAEPVAEADVEEAVTEVEPTAETDVAEVVTEVEPTAEADGDVVAEAEEEKPAPE